LDPSALTIGFARRFATYKRATLVMRDIDRLLRLANDRHRPVQFIFAGKSHPEDHGGKELIKQIIQVARRDDLRNRIVFIENYDINVARYLVSGCDVWLNVPRRPHEASGTSGMKAAMNGVLHMSILDGWWDEAYRSGLGFAIGRREQFPDEAVQDEVEGRLIYDVLEQEVIPAFYERGRDDLPRRWIAMMKASIRELGLVFNTNRMVYDYAEGFYLPAGRRRRTCSTTMPAPCATLSCGSAGCASTGRMFASNESTPRRLASTSVRWCRSVRASALGGSMSRMSSSNCLTVRSNRVGRSPKGGRRR
jgi:starch phosphorylase